MVEITPAEGQQKVKDGAVLVDVREANEYSEVHAQGAVLIPLSEFESRYTELPKDKELVVICRSGARSARAIEFLEKNGYNETFNLGGGTIAWVEAGLPAIRG